MALRPVLVDTKDTQISANWGKQWGKHYPHFAAFFCTGLHWKNAKTLAGTAFQRIEKKGYETKLDPSGPQNFPRFTPLLFSANLSCVAKTISKRRKTDYLKAACFSRAIFASNWIVIASKKPMAFAALV